MPTNVYLGDDDENKELVLTDILEDVIYRLNSKEIGIYEEYEVLTGQTWFNSVDENDKRGVFRKVLKFISLTAAGTTSVAHEIGDISGFTFTRIYGSARNTAGTLHVALPQGGPDDVMITIGANNVNIICATGTYNGFSALVVLEYLKN
jgi:hypothetical protein